MASIVSKLLGLGAGYGRQAISRVLPASEERILGNLERKAQEMLQRAAQKDTGFTFDPRRGKFLEPGKQSGSMMASVPNLPGQSSGAGTVQSVDELIATAKRPEVMSRLQRGEYLGGWNPEGGGVGLDPSRRFLTEFGALRSGLKTDQMGGFSLLRQRGYDVTPGELSSARKRLVAGTAAGALAAGTAGALAVPGRNPVKDFVEGLKGNKEQSDAATFSGRLAREALIAGALPIGGAGAAKNISKSIAGVKKAVEAAGDVAPSVARSRFLVAANNPSWGELSKEALVTERAKTLSDLLSGSKFVAPTASEISALDQTGKFVDEVARYTDETKLLRQIGPRQIAPVEQLPFGEYEVASNLKSIGMTPISVRGKTIDMTKVSPNEVLLHYAQKRDVEGFSEAYSQMVNNQLSLYSPAKIKNILDGKDPAFYPLARDYIITLSEMTGLPPHVIGIGSAVASAKSAPWQEADKLLSASKLLAVRGNKVVVDLAGLTADEVRYKSLAVQIANAMAKVINDPAYAHTDISGIANKTWLYMLSKFDPTNFGIYTNDSIDTFISAASTQSPYTGTKFGTSLMGRAAGMGASSRAGLPSPLGQSVSWQPMRILRGDTTQVQESFSPQSLSMAEDVLATRFGKAKQSRNVGETLREVGDFGRSKVDELIKNNSVYKMTESGILVPDIESNPGLLVPAKARTEGSAVLEKLSRDLAKALKKDK